MARKRKSDAAAASASAAAEPAPAAATDAKAQPEAQEEGEQTKKAKKAPRKKKEPEPRGPFYSQSLRPTAPANALRLLSWNVAGLRAVLKKDPDAIPKLLAREPFDVLCLQEIKVSDTHVEDLEAAVKLPGWHYAWNCCSAKAGYSGVATVSKVKALSVSKGIGRPELDDEGRVLVMEHPDFWLVNAYVPNSGEGLKRLDFRIEQWDPALSAFCKGLETRGKPVILTGDLNCCHREIDIWSPKTNLKSAGFTPQERESFTAQYTDKGFVDTFRAQHPDVVGYTYYSHRSKNAREENKGWRLDYFLVSGALAPRCVDSFMLPDWPGSDHVPLGLILSQPSGTQSTT